MHADRTQLQQVVVNLAMNAMQAMAQSPRTRTLHIVTACDADGVRCTVEDSGPGVDQSHLDRLFESFFTTKEGGMGMGLPICRSIIEAHGGRIRADNASALGGARFTFWLPAADSNSARPSKAPTDGSCGVVRHLCSWISRRVVSSNMKSVKVPPMSKPMR